jgi:hypothetical protein
MSLDFYLESPPCPHGCGHAVRETFWKNITHNLGTMARKAGIYEVLWHPNDNGQVTAKDILPRLEDGLHDLKFRPEYFSQFNSPNGWGRYEHFVPFVEAVVAACKANPDALVVVSI